jgi:hypothetical protein
MVTDGVSGATVYPGTPVVHTWDMRGMDGDLIDEGHYLVYVQMSAERAPRDIENGVMSGGTVAVGIETCWDDPAYDNLGNHRVVELMEFKDSSFTKVVAKERKYSGDQYEYMEGGMTFAYDATASSRRVAARYDHRPSEVTVSTRGAWSLPAVRVRLGAGSATGLRLHDAQGRVVLTLPVPQTGHVTLGDRGDDGMPLAPGLYTLHCGPGSDAARMFLR